MSLRRLALAVLLAAAVPAAARAQVQISCTLRHTRVLPLEPLMATVRIDNQTGTPIQVGDGGGASLSFVVESSPGRAVNLLRPPDEVSFTVPAHGRFEGTFFLHDTYDLRRPRPYTVQARLIWRNQVFGSARTNLDVVPGMEVASAVAALLPEEGARPARRTYSLHTLSRNQQEVLLIRIEDPDQNLVYAVHGLGRIVRGRPPALRIDGEGNAHVLHRISPFAYAYHVIGPDGHLIDQEGLSTEGEALDLSEDGRGRIRVQRGERVTPIRPPGGLR